MCRHDQNVLTYLTVIIWCDYTNVNAHNSMNGNSAANLGNEAALLVTLNLGEVRIGPSVYHHLIQHLVLLPLHGLAVTEHLTEQPHAQSDVYTAHLQTAGACLVRMWCHRQPGRINAFAQ